MSFQSLEEAMKSLFLLLLLAAPVHAKMPAFPEPSLCEFHMSKILSPKLREAQPPGDEDFGHVLMHWCPGCNARHIINVEKPLPNGAKWTWDGNVDAPTFSPSINIVGQCHYFIRNGMIEFCGDSAHELAGQTVPLPDFPEWTR
jgi:hypothetical protein